MKSIVNQCFRRLTAPVTVNTANRAISTVTAININQLQYKSPIPITRLSTIRSFSSSTANNNNNNNTTDNNIINTILPSISSAGPRPFRILGLQQIAIGNIDKSVLATLWCDILGCKYINNYKSTKENVNEDILSIGNGHTAVEIDLMEPIDISKSPKVHIPALNHIGLWIDNLNANTIKWLNNVGIRFTPGGIRKGAAGYNVIFIHPKGSLESPRSGEGVLIELVEAPPEVIKALTSTN